MKIEVTIEMLESLAEGIQRKCAKLQEMASGGRGEAEERAKRVAAEERLAEIDALREASIEDVASRARTAFYDTSDSGQVWTIAGQRAAWLRVARAITPVPGRVEVTREMAERAWGVYCRTTDGDAFDAMRAALLDFAGNSSANLTGSTGGDGSGSEAPNGSHAADASSGTAQASTAERLAAFRKRIDTEPEFAKQAWGNIASALAEDEPMPTQEEADTTCAQLGVDVAAASARIREIVSRAIQEPSPAPASPSPESADRVQAQIAGLVRAVRLLSTAIESARCGCTAELGELRDGAENALKEVDRG